MITPDPEEGSSLSVVTALRCLLRTTDSTCSFVSSENCACGSSVSCDCGDVRGVGGACGDVRGGGGDSGDCEDVIGAGVDGEAGSLSGM